jgi:hypothetical protein
VILAAGSRTIRTLLGVSQGVLCLLPFRYVREKPFHGKTVAYTNFECRSRELLSLNPRRRLSEDAYSSASLLLAFWYVMEFTRRITMTSRVDSSEVTILDYDRVYDDMMSLEMS